mmetsp:Transcript_9026/g.25183  ORF Transcript_9026/g.25183 Transcript_9026/m.25183 type:complete len:289 (+) Transcript_9026:271-1137(+)
MAGQQPLVLTALISGQALLWVAAEQLLKNVLAVCADISPWPLLQVQSALARLPHECLPRAALEGRRPGQDKVQDPSSSEAVNGAPVPPAQQHLRGRVAQGANAQGQLLGLGRLHGDPEIREHTAAISHKQHVLRLHVPVDDTVRMDMPQSREDTPDHGRGRSLCEAPRGTTVVAEVPARSVVKCNGQTHGAFAAAGSEEAKKLYDVWVGLDIDKAGHLVQNQLAIAVCSDLLQGHIISIDPLGTHNCGETARPKDILPEAAHGTEVVAQATRGTQDCQDGLPLVGIAQ